MDCDFSQCLNFSIEISNDEYKKIIGKSKLVKAPKVHDGMCIEIEKIGSFSVTSVDNEIMLSYEDRIHHHGGEVSYESLSFDQKTLKLVVRLVS